MIIVPHKRLSQEALQGVVEEYVTRDGTEMTDADQKIGQVMRQINSGHLVITYDEESGSCNIVRAEALP